MNSTYISTAQIIINSFIYSVSQQINKTVYATDLDDSQNTITANVWVKVDNKAKNNICYPFVVNSDATVQNIQDEITAFSRWFFDQTYVWRNKVLVYGITNEQIMAETFFKENVKGDNKYFVRCGDFWVPISRADLVQILGTNSRKTQVVFHTVTKKESGLKYNKIQIESIVKF